MPASVGPEDTGSSSTLRNCSTASGEAPVPTRIAVTRSIVNRPCCSGGCGGAGSTEASMAARSCDSVTGLGVRLALSRVRLRPFFPCFPLRGPGFSSTSPQVITSSPLPVATCLRPGSVVTRPGTGAGCASRNGAQHSLPPPKTRLQRNCRRHQDPVRRPPPCRVRSVLTVGGRALHPVATHTADTPPARHAKADSPPPPDQNQGE